MSRFQCPGAEKIIAVMNDKGFVVFENGPSHNLNIIGIRSDDDEANTFNDWVTVSYFFDDIWNTFAFPATTDPGTHWRLEPINVLGTAIMKPGQYRGAYKVGKHKNYKANGAKGSDHCVSRREQGGHTGCNRSRNRCRQLQSQYSSC